MAIIWNRILERFQATSKGLQSYKFDIGTVINLYDSLTIFLTSMRSNDEFGQMEKEAKKSLIVKNTKPEIDRENMQNYLMMIHLNELRTTMALGHMSALSLLCIENDIVESLQFDDIIDDYAKQKARKMPIL
ncbi:hypothetical protein Btru_072951 [Bulinus truncatus]|nr:hypothetical protein Btru_072951 [Bulinus truncatus]